jgi:membrane-associated phospholipid phosphatase
MPSSKDIKWYLLCLAVILPFLYFDQDVIVWIREFRNANPEMGQYFQLGDKAAYYAAHGTPLIGGTLLLYLFGRYTGRQKARSIGKVLFIGCISSGMGVQIIKHLIGRARPRITDQLLFVGPTFAGSYDSFPSGHAVMAFCMAYLCSGYFPKYTMLFYLYAIFVCCGRVFSTSHFPADVLGGALLGIIIARVIKAAIGRTEAANMEVNPAEK